MYELFKTVINKITTENIILYLKMYLENEQILLK